MCFIRQRRFATGYATGYATGMQLVCNWYTTAKSRTGPVAARSASRVKRESALAWRNVCQKRPASPLGGARERSQCPEMGPAKPMGPKSTSQPGLSGEDKEPHRCARNAPWLHERGRAPTISFAGLASPARHWRGQRAPSLRKERPKEAPNGLHEKKRPPTTSFAGLASPARRRPHQDAAPNGAPKSESEEQSTPVRAK